MFCSVKTKSINTEYREVGDLFSRVIFFGNAKLGFSTAVRMVVFDYIFSFVFRKSGVYHHDKLAPEQGPMSLFNFDLNFFSENSALKDNDIVDFQN